MAGDGQEGGGGVEGGDEGFCVCHLPFTLDVGTRWFSVFVSCFVLNVSSSCSWSRLPCLSHAEDTACGTVHWKHSMQSRFSKTF